MLIKIWQGTNLCLSRQKVQLLAVDQKLTIFWSKIDENSLVWLFHIASDSRFDQICSFGRLSEKQQELFSSIFDQKMVKFWSAAKKRPDFELSGTLFRPETAIWNFIFWPEKIETGFRYALVSCNESFGKEKSEVQWSVGAKILAAELLLSIFVVDDRKRVYLCACHWVREKVAVSWTFW